MLAAGACRHRATAPAPAIRFLHTFGPDETELFNTIVRERGLVVDSSLVPFARGQQVISEILARGGPACPDLIRIDATWLPALRSAGLLAPVPGDLAARDWTPEARNLVTSPWNAGQGMLFGVPQAVDGLVVVRDSSRPAPASDSIADLVLAARATKTESSPFPLNIHINNY